MISANATIRPLPMQTRPRPGERIDSYVHRLARTNHLRPCYLRRLLLTNPSSRYGNSVSLARLAALTGRHPSDLERVFPPPAASSSPRRLKPVQSPNRRPYKQADKPELFAAIRDAAKNDNLSIRALANRFQVHRRTIRQALTTPTPPARKKTLRPSCALRGLDGHINAMLHANPTIPAGHIWDRLLDDHDSTASYSTVRDYVTRHRRSRTNSDKID